MKNAGALHGDVTDALSVYFRQCSVLVTARDIAVMAATLANGGLNPITGEQVTSEAIALAVCSVMATCGMYDGSGEWMLRVGLPAKSGVSGTIIALSPGQFGVGLYSPPLDVNGNSVRGVLACREMSDQFDLHVLSRPVRHARAVRTSGNELQLSIELRGDIGFVAAEQVMRKVLDRLPTQIEINLDLSQAGRVTEPARRLLRTTMDHARSEGVRIEATVAI
jgi:glutaminase